MIAVATMKVIAEALGRKWCEERSLKPEGWCVYRPAENGRPAECIETYLQWQVAVNMDNARAVFDALEKAGLLKEQP